MSHKTHQAQNTYCNPISIPNYPRGIASINNKNQKDFRDMADPSVLYYNSKWYLYPSNGMAYVSEDFINWQHYRITPEIFYAPTVAYYKNRFYLAANRSPLYISDNPLGPFTEIGSFKKPDNSELSMMDPMIFPDDDGRLYLYWGGGVRGVFGAELDPDKPNQLITWPKNLFSFNPEHEWECFGNWNEDKNISNIEGSWMLKHNQKYFLTYTAPGTQLRTYAMGTYVCDTPLGEFRYQARNPILTSKSGLIQGPGHGCFVHGPNNTLWAFYTLITCYEHSFERRIGYDPAGFDDDGNLYVNGSSEPPQLAPGILVYPEKGNSYGTIQVTSAKKITATSSSPGRDALYAFDDSMLTWWQPEEMDPQKQLTISLRSSFMISSQRIIWRDVGLDYDNGIVPDPFGYKVEVALGAALADLKTLSWKTILDNSDNQTDMLIDYKVFDEIEAQHIRLTITNYPNGIQPGVINFTVFGRSIRK